MSTLVIVQARLGSTRLPGKVLMDIGGHPCLWHVMERVKLAGLPYILTIPDDPAEDALYQYVMGMGWPVSRGPHPDVLAAFVKAWREAGGTATSIVRVTADCPFVQPRAITWYAEIQTYVSNAHPRRVPKGLDVEGFGTDLMIRAGHVATDPDDRHHVTPYLRRAFGLETDIDEGEFRVTLDTAGDLAVLQDIGRTINVTPPHPTLDELRAYFKARATGG